MWRHIFQTKILDRISLLRFLLQMPSPLAIKSLSIIKWIRPYVLPILMWKWLWIVVSLLRVQLYPWLRPPISWSTDAPRRKIAPLVIPLLIAKMFVKFLSALLTIWILQCWILSITRNQWPAFWSKVYSNGLLQKFDKKYKRI